MLNLEGVLLSTQVSTCITKNVMYFLYLQEPPQPPGSRLEIFYAGRMSQNVMLDIYSCLLRCRSETV